MTSEDAPSQSMSFDDFLDLLAAPKACDINKTLFKKMFLEASDGKKSMLDAADKKALKDEVDKVRWLYTLKPNTINISPYKDQERDYPEIAILHIELAKPDKLKRIAQFINRAIPYPLVLLFTCLDQGQEKLLIALADKRINQADKEKWVIEDSIQSPWVDLASINSTEMKFLESLHISGLSFANFYAFYQSFIERVVAIQCAEHSGKFMLGNSDTKHEDVSSTGRLEKLRELERLGAQRSEISNRLKKIKQMGKQIELNTQIKKINDKMASIKGSL